MFNLCKQASIFFVISILTLIGSITMGGKLHAIIPEIIIITLITYALNILCKNKYNKLAWILMFIPSIVYVFLLLIMIASFIRKYKI